MLAGPLVRQPGLRAIQERYRTADSETVRRALALEFEKAIVGARRRAAAPIDAGLPVAEFFPRCLVHAKGPAAGRPFVLEPWQRRFVEEFTRLDPDGGRVFKRGLLGIARGNGKSPLAAGLAHELLAAEDEPDIILAAGARDQARVVFEYSRGLVERGPLAELLNVGRHEIRNPANGVSFGPFRRTGSSPTA